MFWTGFFVGAVATFVFVVVAFLYSMRNFRVF